MFYRRTAVDLRTYCGSAGESASVFSTTGRRKKTKTGTFRAYRTKSSYGTIRPGTCNAGGTGKFCAQLCQTRPRFCLSPQNLVCKFYYCYRKPLCTRFSRRFPQKKLGKNAARTRFPPHLQNTGRPGNPTNGSCNPAKSSDQFPVGVHDP